MAPKKRSRSENPPPTVTSKRVTRSSSSSSSATISSKPTAQPLPPAHKKPKTKIIKAPSTPPAAPSKTVVIEHCKQCNQFKTRAFKVKEALENDIPWINVLVNPEKPRRGCFEVREEGGEIFISLLDMKRPFQPMRALDMEKVISDILDKLK